MLTPHQLSTEAKQLIRNGMSEDRFVKEVAEKGYWSGSKQLCQEIDLELHIHLFKHNKETYLAVQRGKHRVPTIIPDESKYFILKFPKNGMPIPDDRDGVVSSFRRLPNISTNADESLFSF